MKAKKAAKKQVKPRAKAKKSEKSKEPKEITVTVNGKRFKVIPAEKKWTREEFLKRHAEVKKIVEKMLNGMSPVEYVEKIRGHF